MQDKTINNALLALRKQGGTEGKLAEVLLDMRGVGWTDWVSEHPMKRGQAKRLVLNALRDGPKTTSNLADLVEKAVPSIDRHTAYNRAYLALRRYSSQGLVVQDFGPDGCFWRIA